jgi:hypothetical protein
MSTFASFRAVRWIRTLNLLAQAVLFITLFGGLNYLAIHYAWRFDLTRHHRHSLSPETRSYLKNLDQPVRVVVTLTEDSDNEPVAQAYRDVSGLLREYGYATENNPKGRVTTELIDVFQRRRDAEALGIDRPNTILVLCGDRRRVIDLSDLYRLENGEKKAFLGEQVFTAAILDVSNPSKRKIYFLSGHGEMQPDDVSPARGLSLLTTELTVRNFEVATWDIAQKHGVPPDAAALVIVGPQGRYDPEEQESLRQYLSTRAGRVIALLPPLFPNGLDDLLYDWGVLDDDVLVYDSGPDGQNDTGDLILRAYAKHPITQQLIDNNVPVRFGPTRSVRPDPGRPLDANLVITELIAASKTAWGERNYRQRGTPIFNAGVDLGGPDQRITVATTSERVTTSGNLPFSVPGGRLVVFGSADWIANDQLATIGNLSLFLATINWATDRDIDLKVPARPVDKFQLSLSQDQLHRLRYSLLLLLPGAAALLGTIVYWTRRS